MTTARDLADSYTDSEVDTLLPTHPSDVLVAQDITNIENLSGTNTGDQTNISGNATTATSATSASNLTGGTVTGDLVAPDANRSSGMYGTYVSTKTQHIWSMGVGYRSSPTGAGFGNLYGMAYKYNSNAGGHSIVFAQNGVEKSSVGTNIWTSGNVTAYSDRRVKTNIKLIPDALLKVRKLNGYTFDRTDIQKDEEGNEIPIPTQTGVIAQEVLEVLPEAVAQNEDGMYSVAYGNIVGLLIEAIKEQQITIDELKSDVIELKAR